MDITYEYCVISSDPKAYKQPEKQLGICLQKVTRSPAFDSTTL